MSPNAALESLLHSPRLPEYAEIIQRKLEQELVARNRFYHEMSDEFKMEFIDGEVILHSPAKYRHLIASRNLTTLLHIWVLRNNLGIVCVEKALCVFRRNDYEPDIVFFGPEKASRIQPDTLKFMTPDFAVEILSDSTENRDRGVKFEDFAAHSVREYWIVDPEQKFVEQYLLNESGTYELFLKSGSGEIASRVVAGFTIPICAIFDDDANRDAMNGLLS